MAPCNTFHDNCALLLWPRGPTLSQERKEYFEDGCFTSALGQVCGGVGVA